MGDEKEAQQGWPERSWVQQWKYDITHRFFIPARLTGKVVDTLDEVRAYLKLYPDPRVPVSDVFSTTVQPARIFDQTDYAGYTILSAQLNQEPVVAPLTCMSTKVTLRMPVPVVDLAYQCGHCQRIRFSPPLLRPHESNGTWLRYEGLEFLCRMCEAPLYFKLFRMNDPAKVGMPTED